MVDQIRNPSSNPVFQKECYCFFLAVFRFPLGSVASFPCQFAGDSSVSKNESTRPTRGMFLKSPEKFRCDRIDDETQFASTRNIRRMRLDIVSDRIPSYRPAAHQKPRAGQGSLEEEISKLTGPTCYFKERVKGFEPSTFTLAT